MVQIKLLKVTHQGTEEATKLRPYIEKCDVFSCEARYLTEAKARSIERDWSIVLKMNRSKFNRLNASRYQRVPPNVVSYNLKRDDYLYRSSKPIIFLERWNNEEAEVLKNAEAIWHNEKVSYLNLLRQGHIDEFLKIGGESLGRFMHNVIIARDKHIAANVERVEQLVQESYRDMDSQNMQFTFELGIGHSPEEFTKREIEVIELAKWEDASQKAMHVLSRRENIADCAREMLVYGLGELVRNKSLQATYDELMSASFDELVSLIKK